MTDVNTLRASLNSGEAVFADTLAFIAAHYDYHPQAFNNGGVENPAGQNEGSWIGRASCRERVSSPV